MSEIFSLYGPNYLDFTPRNELSSQGVCMGHSKSVIQLPIKILFKPRRRGIDFDIILKCLDDVLPSETNIKHAPVNTDTIMV